MSTSVESDGGELGGTPRQNGVAKDESSQSDSAVNVEEATQAKPALTLRQKWSFSFPVSVPKLPTIDGDTKAVASGFASLAMSYAKKVKSTVELATADLERRNKEFLQMEAEEIERSAKLNALAKRASLPWAGCVNEDQVREQILALSTDKRNLLMDIPDGAEFEFDLKTASPVAVAVLKIDKALDSLRFELVPKHIKDETFWRNYFYRVHLIKVSAQLSDATAKSPTLGTVVKTPADAKDEKESTSTSKIKSQISDTAKGNSPEICEGNADGDFEGEEDDEDWERQLQEELKDEE